MSSQDAYPSAEILASLAQLDQTDQEYRHSRAWQLVMQAAPNDDFPVILDYAIDRNLILAPGEEPTEAPDGQRIISRIWVNPTDGSEMVWIPPGPFLVGKENTRVDVPGFSLARHPVTNIQFYTFLEETGYDPPAGHPNAALYLHHWHNGAPVRGEEDHPVVYISHLDALHYCQWAGLTLPTEWLWEKAARGTDGRRFPWGDAIPYSKQRHANLVSTHTVAVGTFEKVRSPYGCEDLMGNVSEWCQMTAGDDPTSIPEPTVRPEQLSVPASSTLVAVRGACFLRQVPYRLGSRDRRRLSITRRNQWVGFRPALLLPYCPIG